MLTLFNSDGITRPSDHSQFNGFTPKIRIDGHEINFRLSDMIRDINVVGYRMENNFLFSRKSFVEFHAANINSDFDKMSELINACIDLLAPENQNIRKELGM